MSVLFYIGPDHHRTHVEFARQLIGGEFVSSGAHGNLQNGYEMVEAHDKPDTIWVFADLYPRILRALKGKAVFLPHGLGFKPYVSDERAELLNRYVHQVWSTGVLEEEKYLRGGVDLRIVRRIGYGVPFLLPREPRLAGSVFVSVGWFEETAPWQQSLALLRSAPREVPVFFSVHPSMPEEIQAEFRALERETLFFVSSEAEMHRMYHRCDRAVAGYSSVVTPFHYLEKPVVMVKTRNRFPLFQWSRLYLRTRSPTWYCIMRRSTRVLLPDPMAWSRIMAARSTAASRSIFYPWNWDREETAGRIRAAVAEFG